MKRKFEHTVTQYFDSKDRANVSDGPTVIELQEEGWELVSVVPVDFRLIDEEFWVKGYTYFLKREVLDKE